MLYLSFQKSTVPNVDELITALGCDKKQQPPAKVVPLKPQLSTVVPSETFCSTSVTPRQRPKPMDTVVTTTVLGSSPVLKRALFPNPSSIQQASQSPDVTCSFVNPPSANTDCADTRFQPTDHTQKPFSVTPPQEATSFDNLFPSNTGRLYYQHVFDRQEKKCIDIIFQLLINQSNELVILIEKFRHWLCFKNYK